MPNSLALGVSANWFAHTRGFTDLDSARRIILEDARQVREDGFEAIELPLPLLGPVMTQATVAYWQELGGALRELGLATLWVHGPNWPYLEETLDEARVKLAPHPRACCALGALVLVAHPTYHTHPHVCTILPRLLQRDIDLARWISDELAVAGGPTRLAIENLPTYSIRYLATLVDRIGRANVGVCFDTGHFHLRPEARIQDAAALFAPHLVHLHLTDNHGLCDEHLPPGAGDFPYQEFFRALPPAWRRGPFLVELSPPILANDADAANKARAVHRAALATTRRTLADIG